MVSVFGVTNVKEWLIEKTAKCESIDRETVRMISDGLFDAFHDKEQRVVIDLNPNCYFFTKFIGTVSGIRDIKNQIYAR